MPCKASTYERPWTRREAVAVPAPASRVRGALRTWRRRIETSAWDERLLRRQRWLDAACWICVAAALLFLLPLCLRIIAG